jgi:hypothetical protein
MRKNKQHFEPVFRDGIYALIIVAVIGWPLLALMRWLWGVHPIASQIVGFALIGWFAVVLVIAGIAAIGNRP